MIKRAKGAGYIPFVPVFGAALLLLACASANPYAKVDHEVSLGHYDKGITYIDEYQKKLYRDKDAILFYLDKGMLAHYDQRYDDSIMLLQEGERAIDAAYTKSVTLEIGSYLVNDNTREYDGEDYEDVYSNAFNALSYYHQNKLEDAVVEIRRMDNKLQFLATKYGILTSNMQKKALEENAAIPSNPEASQFNDSALARYLGVLFHRGVGNFDGARIDQSFIKLAFANAPSVYSYPVPASVDMELLPPPPGQARLNVLAFSGLAPVKEEEIIRIPLPGPRWIKIALPVMVYRPSQVRRIEVLVDNGERFDLELLEDIEAVARETFKQKAALIYLKTVIRASIKGVTSSVLGAVSEEASGEAGLILWLASLGAQAVAEVSERADLRISRYFPAKAWVGGINLNPGVYPVRVNYYNANNHLIFTYNDRVDVQANSLNLMEAVCTK